MDILYTEEGQQKMAFLVCWPERSDRNVVVHIDEIAQYQAGKYISSNEAVWRILSFPIHERNPTVVHLAVHLENGQRAYFKTGNVQQIVLNPPTITSTVFFTLCQNDPFAKTLLYSEVPSYYTWNASRKSFERRKRGELVEGQPGIFRETTIVRNTISPNRSAAASLDVELHREQNYNLADLLIYVQSNIPKLTFEQRSIYDRIMQTVSRGVGETFFLDAPGGTGETFLVRLILATIRSQNGIALALASSGISYIVTSISKTSSIGKVLQKCKLIVWDECTMAYKKSIETLHRSLQDLRGNIRPFGNALILFAGEFRQTKSVIPRSTPADEINACLDYSVL
ncbi:unnamed protein product [Onchocerca ochengi]|uniref:ATP-dependent DNA helicase n=1 Tax=Onchocerca ochengi TaxID=42157 RepID=A0A182EV21_ONCOC|nr:unnamed protein product [Onchocerca ochengi]